MGLQRGSLYAAFGDKHDLYLKTVALYVRENREHLEALLQDGQVLPALRRMLLEPSALTGAPDRPQGRRGCLVGNTTAELVPGDEEARALAAAASDGFIEVVTVALARARRRERSRRARPPRAKRGCCCSSSRARPWCRAPNPATSASPPASTPHSTRYASADLPMWPFSSVRAAGLGKVLAAQREVPAPLCQAVVRHPPLSNH